MTSELRKYNKAGYTVISLNGIMKNGKCGCGYDDCKIAGKHPTLKNWQNHFYITDENQLQGFELLAELNGFGVLLKNKLLVIDVDPRNGGDKKALFERFPSLEDCKYAVQSGRGEGGHYYFKYDGEIPTRTTHPDFPGIDFKTSGFVCGPDSPHVSGGKSKVLFGDICDLSEAPSDIIEFLKRPACDPAAAGEGEYSEVAEIVSRINNDRLEYDDWVSIGMAIHSSLNGEGFEIFDEFSSNCDKYDAKTTQQKWNSFRAGGGYG